MRSKRRARVDKQPTSVGPNVPFPIVGVGASAGGLEALTQLLAELPSDTGMAFVLIQHLDPTHPSLLADALAKATTMMVGQAKDGERVVPDHVYVIPPDADVAIRAGVLTLVTRKAEARKLHLPVDYFLASLAEELGKQAIGVVLSGTASDGTEGLRAIKRRRRDHLRAGSRSRRSSTACRAARSMRASSTTVLPVPELARELHRLSRHPYVSAASSPPSASDDRVLDEIFDLVRNALGVDFGEYKAPSLQRRLARRMALLRIERLRDYLALLRDHPEEAAQPVRGRPHPRHLVLSGSRRLREPEVRGLSGDPEDQSARRAHPLLGRRVLDRGGGLLARHLLCSSSWTTRPDATPSRSSARTSASAPSRRPARVPTPTRSMRDVSEERRRRFFTKVESGYRINKNVRELCVFVRHDLARDPPFSKLDLVSLPQRTHLLRPSAPAAGPADLSLRPAAGRVPSPRPRGEHLRLQTALLADRQDQQGLRPDRGGEHAPVRSPDRGASGHLAG